MVDLPARAKASVAQWKSRVFVKLRSSVQIRPLALALAGGAIAGLKAMKKEVLINTEELQQKLHHLMDCL